MDKKVLLLPFLQMSSGHHRVADNISRYITNHIPQATCRKVDILHYSYGTFESFITKFYLLWIRRYPNSYHYVYSLLAGSKSRTDKRHHRMYDLMFLPFMRRLLREEKPDLIICTHSLPSHLLSVMKQANEIDTPVINVYTDFFINNLWGIQGIDQHWVADPNMKSYLQQNGIPEERIFTTGIPVAESFRTDSITHSVAEGNEAASDLRPFTVLISGGNLGVGGLEQFVTQLGESPMFRYIVLCGKNERLYRRLSEKADPSKVTPMPFIESPEEMNELYDRVDAVFCKPGGVTISECLFRQKPVFVFSALPGQETYNLQILKERGLLWDLAELQNEYGRESMELAVAEVLQSEREMEQWRRTVARFKDAICAWDRLIHQTLV